MSHYVDVVTQVTDKKALVRALERIGFKNHVEEHDTAQNLYGYQGDIREQKAHVIIRREHVGMASNDIGFFRNPEGRFVSYISEYDSGRYNQDWKKKLYTYYGVEKAKLEYDSMGLSYTEDVDEKERPRLRVRM